jgi:hypothetical protein
MQMSCAEMSFIIIIIVAAAVHCSRSVQVQRLNLLANSIADRRVGCASAAARVCLLLLP